VHYHKLTTLYTFILLRNVTSLCIVVIFPFYEYLFYATRAFPVYVILMVL